jgi:hypothetical protein
MNPTDAYREKIGDRLTRQLAQLLKDGGIDRDELAEISTYILENIDKATSNSELLRFLENISAKWPFLSDMIVSEKNEVATQEQQGQVQQIGELIDQNKINDALEVAKDANDNQEQQGQRDQGGTN